MLVEMAVIETASENTFPQISTSIAVSLIFPSRNAARQAFRFGSPVLCDGLQGAHPYTFTADDAPYSAAVLRGERLLQIKQQEVLFDLCRLFS